MKKISIVFLVFMLAAVFPSQAGIRFGAKAGSNLTHVAFNKSDLDAVNFTGFFFGPAAEISLGTLTLETAVLYEFKQMNDRENLKRLFKDIETDFSEKKGTLSIPVYLKYKFDVSDMAGVFVTAGPDIAFKLNGQHLSDLKNEFADKSFGAGFSIGGGVLLLEHLQIGLNYRFGLTDEYSSFNYHDIKDIKSKPRTWSISATYFF
jgi:hypothetical protein